MQGHYPARIGLGQIWNGDVNNASLRRHFSVEVITGLGLFFNDGTPPTLGGWKPRGTGSLEISSRYSTAPERPLSGTTIKSILYEYRT